MTLSSAHDVLSSVVHELDIDGLYITAHPTRTQDGILVKIKVEADTPAADLDDIELSIQVNDLLTEALESAGFEFSGGARSLPGPWIEFGVTFVSGEYSLWHHPDSWYR